jgi:hypothetical protein
MPLEMSDEYKEFVALAATARAHRRSLFQANLNLQRRIRATAMVIEYLARATETAWINPPPPNGFDGTGEKV